MTNETPNRPDGLPISGQIYQRIHRFKESRGGYNAGLLVAQKWPDGVIVSWSLCNYKKDRFSVENGLALASSRILYARSIGFTPEGQPRRKSGRMVPHSIRHDMHRFMVRVAKYFKVEVVYVTDLMPSDLLVNNVDPEMELHGALPL